MGSVSGGGPYDHGSRSLSLISRDTLGHSNSYAGVRMGSVTVMRRWLAGRVQQKHIRLWLTD